MEIVPAILVHSARDFVSRITSPVMDSAPLVHIDIMDGSFTTQSCISHPDLIPGDFSTPIELHLMVDSPVSFIEQWSSLPQVKRVIIHVEIAGDVPRALLVARDLDIECCLALNPSTSISHIEPYLSFIDSVLVMGVVPGASGQAFLGQQILDKINSVHKAYPDLSIAVDGGVRANLLPTLRSLPVSRACTSSAVWSQDVDPITAYKRLLFV